VERKGWSWQSNGAKLRRLWTSCKKPLDIRINSLGRNPMSKKNRLNELRAQIEEEAKYVDVKPFSHNIITSALGLIQREFDTEQANRAVRDFGLEEKGWSQI
jgi:hypothetical protein